MQFPLVSVILPIYNGEPYLHDAIVSILAQTWKNFELILIDDGSNDGSSSIIKQFSDPRIRVFLKKNEGLAKTLNRGIEIAKGDYIARMDQDDIALPERFHKQVHFLKTHPDYGMVGTWANIMKDGKVRNKHLHPNTNCELQFALLFDNPFVHSSVMIRKTILTQSGLYSTDPTRQPPEDYELWSRVSRICKIANLEEILMIYREVGNSMSRTSWSEFINKVVDRNVENISFYVANESVELPTIAALAHWVHGLSFKSRCTSKKKVFQLIEKLQHLIVAIHGEKDSLTRIQKQSMLLQSKINRHIPNNVLTYFSWIRNWK